MNSSSPLSYDELVERFSDHLSASGPPVNHASPGALTYSLERCGLQFVEAAWLTTLLSALTQGPSDERIAEVAAIMNEKYFGDYELSQTQMDAVWDAFSCMCVLQKVRAALAPIEAFGRDVKQAWSVRTRAG